MIIKNIALYFRFDRIQGCSCDKVDLLSGIVNEVF